MPKPATPSRVQRESINKAIVKAREASETEALYRDGAYARSMSALQRANNRPWYSVLFNLDEDSRARGDAAQAETILADLRRTKYEFFNQALYETIAAYELIPRITDYSGLPGAPPNMNTTAWRPRYSELEKWDREQRRYRRDENMANAGRTRPDGTISIFETAFADPDELAIIILHETRHWLQASSRSGGLKPSDPPSIVFEQERDAYLDSSSFARRLGRVDIAERHDEYRARYSLQATRSIGLSWNEVRNRHPDWIGSDRDGRLAAALPPDDPSPMDERALAEKLAEAQLAVKRHRAERAAAAELERRRLDLRVIVGRPPAPSPHQPSTAAPGRRPADMTAYDLARYACQSPGFVTEELAEQIEFQAFLAIPNHYRSQLSGCALAVYDELMALVAGKYGNSSATADWIKALGYKNQHLDRQRDQPSESVAPPPPPRSGGDCHRGGDPFGCQPRHP